MRNVPSRFVPILILVAAAAAQTPAAAAGTKTAPPLQMRLQPLLDGLREDAPKGDLSAVATTTIGKEAAKVGLDLTKPKNPLVAMAYRDGRLFYVFYKVTDEAFGERAWMLQRIRKIERTWATADAAPEEKVTWQVEAFKTNGGSLKGSDEHFGSFALRTAHRREIVKEYEIGFGELAGKAEGAGWPFAMDTLFHMLQPYGDDATLHDRVKFTASRRWTLTVSFDATGAHQVLCPELGLDLPKKVPGPELARSPVDPASKAIVLTAGAGPAGVTVGTSKRADVDKALGAVLEDVPVGPSNRNVSYRGGLTCNFDADGVLNTVFTRPSFGGRTKEGVLLGMSRAEVRKKLGAVAKDQDDGAERWTLPGLTVVFDAAGTVRRVVVSKR